LVAVTSSTIAGAAVVTSEITNGMSPEIVCVGCTAEQSAAWPEEQAF